MVTEDQNDCQREWLTVSVNGSGLGGLEQGIYGGSRLSDGKQFEPIGTEGLLGHADKRFITVGGPCGGYHIMSHKAAGELREWLGAKLGSALSEKDREHIVKLLMLTTSDFDGEALTALRKANSALAAAKLTWGDLLR